MALSTTQYGYIIDPMVPFTDDKGNTIKDGFVRVFVAGSSTPVVTYRNFDGAANQDLIELDNSGRTKTSVIGSKGLTYKVCVYDKHHSQESPILTVDKVSVIGANITAGAGSTVVTGLDGLTTKPDGFVDASVVGTDGYVALDHTLVTDDLTTDAKATAVENDRYVPLLNDDVNDPDSKMKLGRLWKWVLGNIKSLSTTITAFRTGDVIPVDGPNGTAKMLAIDLLRVTAENALLKIIDDFSSSKSYSPGDIVLHDGNVRMFTKEHSESAYDASKTINVSLENIEAFKASNSGELLKWYPRFGFETEPGFRFDPWGNVVEDSDFSISDYVEITQGKKYRLHTKGSMFGNQTPIVFYGAEKNKLSYTSAPTETRVFEFVAPANARYVRFSSNDLAATVYNDYFIECLEDVMIQNSIQIISAIPADSKGTTRFPSNFIKGYYADAWGNPVRNDDFDISQFIEVEGGCSYTLDFGTNAMFANNQGVSFFTKELRYISSIRPNTTVCKITINTPSNCKFIQYSRWNHNPIKDSITKESDSTMILDNSFDCINVIPFANVFFVAEKPVTFYAESMVDTVVHGSVFVKNLYSSGNKFNRRNAVVLNSYEVICRFGLFDSHGRISNKCFFLNARKVDANAKNGETINVLMIGDSLSDYSRITKPLTSLFADDVANINIIGTKVYNGVKNEGRSGWSSYDYCHSESYNGYSNPFLVEGSFDIPAYLQNNNLATPDVFIIELGTNDTWRPMGETTTKINIEEMIASALQANNDCKVIILTTCFPYAGINDASETVVLDSKKVMFDKTLEMYSDFWNRESEGIYIVNMGGTYDPVYSYNREAVSVNDTEVIYKCTDNIHPSHIGYEQIAKSIYAAIKYV